MVQCSPTSIQGQRSSQQWMHLLDDQRAHGLPQDLVLRVQIQRVLTRQPLPTPKLLPRTDPTEPMRSGRRPPGGTLYPVAVTRMLSGCAA